MCLVSKINHLFLCVMILATAAYFCCTVCHGGETSAGEQKMPRKDVIPENSLIDALYRKLQDTMRVSTGDLASSEVKAVTDSQKSIFRQAKSIGLRLEDISPDKDPRFSSNIIPLVEQFLHAFGYDVVPYATGDVQLTMRVKVKSGLSPFHNVYSRPDGSVIGTADLYDYVVEVSCIVNFPAAKAVETHSSVKCRELSKSLRTGAGGWELVEAKSGLFDDLRCCTRACICSIFRAMFSEPVQSIDTADVLIKRLSVDSNTVTCSSDGWPRDEFINLGKTAVSQLIRGLSSNVRVPFTDGYYPNEGDSVGCLSAYILASMNPQVAKEAGPELVGFCLKHRDAKLELNQGLQALALIVLTPDQQSRILPLIKEVLQNKKGYWKDTYEASAIILSRMERDNPEVLPALIDALQVESYKANKVAATALGSSGEQAVPILSAFLLSPYYYPGKDWLIEALTQIGTKSAVDILTKYVSGKGKYWTLSCKGATQALAKIGRPYLVDVMPSLLSLLDDRDHDVAADAQKALQELTGVGAWMSSKEWWKWFQDYKEKTKARSILQSSESNTIN